MQAIFHLSVCSLFVISEKKESARRETLAARQNLLHLLDRGKLVIGVFLGTFSIFSLEC